MLGINISLAVLTGCSALDIGSGDYSCPGMPSGVQCMSARDVYSATNDGNVPRPMKVSEKEGMEIAERSDRSKKIAEISDPIIDNYVAPRLPDKPIPVRTPAQVMRIWVAPWEDKNGDLIVTGYIYTEIEPRRWIIGDSSNNKEAILRPLQTIQHKPKTN